MQQPSLIIVAGCNGSGKSTYSKTLFESSIEPFDYDKLFLENYNKLCDSEFREKFAQTQTTEKFDSLLLESFNNFKSFCFETNFVSFPTESVRKAKSLGYKIEIYFFCLIDIQKAKERVAIRVKNDGHDVAESIIEYKWKEGYKTINQNFQLADYLLFIDNSDDNSVLSPIFDLVKVAQNKFEVNQILETMPEYTQRRLPEVFKLF